MADQYQQIGFSIRVINNLLRSRYDDVLRSYDLTKPQFDMLMFLKRAHDTGTEISQRDLETFFHISNPTVSSMLGRLECKGLIERKTAHGDRRIRHVTVTEKAISLIGQIGSLLIQSRASMYTGLTEEELEQGQRFLNHILRNLTGKEEHEFDFDPCKTD